jgi:hypothetical protein
VVVVVVVVMEVVMVMIAVTGNCSFLVRICVHPSICVSVALKMASSACLAFYLNLNTIQVVVFMVMFGDG